MRELDFSKENIRGDWLGVKDFGGDGLRDQVLKLVKRMLGKVLLDVEDINGANFGEVTGMVVIVGIY